MLLATDVWGPLLDGLVPTLSIAVATAALRLMSKRQDRRQQQSAKNKKAHDDERNEFAEVADDVARMRRVLFGEERKRGFPGTVGFVDETRNFMQRTSQQLTTISESLAEIGYQVKPNGGDSMADKVNAMHKHQIEEGEEK